MDINKILDELRQQRTQIEEAILSIERIAAGKENVEDDPSGARTRNKPKHLEANTKSVDLLT